MRVWYVSETTLLSTYIYKLLRGKKCFFFFFFCFGLVTYVIKMESDFNVAREHGGLVARVIIKYRKYICSPWLSRCTNQHLNAHLNISFHTVPY